MKSSKSVLLGLAAAAAMTLAGQAQAADTGGVKVGVLTCNVSAGFGLVFGSTRNLNCAFQSNGKLSEAYSGHIDRFGVDIGFQKGGVMVWAVFAPTGDMAPGALAGDYGGVTAGAAAGVGAAANVLVGGSAKTVSLAPLSIEGAPGLNIAAGVASMKQTYTKP
jgi:hypothetical protein